MADLEEISRNYFATMSPTASRVHQELTVLASLLGGQWRTLSDPEKNELIDDHFIPSDVRETHRCVNSPENNEQCYPKLSISSDRSIVSDNDGETWEDEHSGSFSWETKSQNEFSLEDNVEQPRPHLKDPKRCKSPRTAGGGNNARTRTSSAPREGVLSGSDFDQLRSMWEHSSVPGATTATDGDTADSPASSSAAVSGSQPHSSETPPPAADGGLQQQHRGAVVEVSKKGAATATTSGKAKVMPVSASVGGGTAQRVSLVKENESVGSARLASAVDASAVSAASPAKEPAQTVSSLNAAHPTSTEVSSRTASGRDCTKLTPANVTEGRFITSTIVAGDDPVFALHGVTFGSAEESAFAGRGRNATGMRPPTSSPEAPASTGGAGRTPRPVQPATVTTVQQLPVAFARSMSADKSTTAVEPDVAQRCDFTNQAYLSTSKNDRLDESISSAKTGFDFLDNW